MKASFFLSLKDGHHFPAPIEILMSILYKKGKTLLHLKSVSLWAFSSLTQENFVKERREELVESSSLHIKEETQILKGLKLQIRP